MCQMQQVRRQIRQSDYAWYSFQSTEQHKHAGHKHIYEEAQGKNQMHEPTPTFFQKSEF